MINITDVKPQEFKCFSDALLAALATSGESLYRVSQDSGVQYASLHRFVKGSTSLHLDVADKLAKHLGITMRLSAHFEKESSHG